MSSPQFPRQLWSAFHGWWREESRQHGVTGAGAALSRELWGFVRDSTPERRRSRYGDMEYDWDHKVNTTTGTVGWRERLLGVFHSPYQPTEPGLFREMMDSLPIDLRDYTFVDLGSGKGRTLLMASEYPFRRIVGVEILPELEKTQQENLRAFQSPTQQCARIESVCMDAREFALPLEPLLLYLFNPLPEVGLRQVIRTLIPRLEEGSQPLWVLYNNPLLSDVLTESEFLIQVRRTEHYALCRSRSTA